MKRSTPLLAVFAFLLAVVTVSAGSVGCNSVATRTQLNFNISASSALQSRIAVLHVFIRSNNRSDQMQDFQSVDLHWPVAIVVIPSNGNDSTDEVTLTATAFDANHTLLASQMVVGKFVPEKARDYAVALDAPDVDSGASDGGVGVVVQDAAPPDDGGPLLPNDAGTNPAPDAAPITDAGTGGPNCATADSGIKCDDGNPCNGTESCDPSNAAANNDGCLSGANVVMCATGTTCDRVTGLCSACGANADGDKDGVSSVSCGGLDCNDSDDTVAPNKPELCDGKDNNCDGVIDGPAANADCTASAPTGGTATCVSTRCAPACTMPTYVIVNKVCTAPLVCAAGSRASLDMTHCVPVGIPLHDIGFENGCDVTTPDPTFSATGTAPIPAAFYSACGVATIANGAGADLPQLARPAAGTVEGIMGATALMSEVTATAASTLVFTFSPAINTLSFDVLGVSDATTVSVVATAGGVALPPANPALVASTMHLHFATTYTTAVSSVSVTYTPTVPAMPPTVPVSNQFYIDELSFRVAGCGDLVPDMTAGELCDRVMCCASDCSAALTSATTPGCPAP